MCSQFLETFVNTIFHKFLVLVYQHNIISESNWFLSSITMQPPLTCIVYVLVSICLFLAPLPFLLKFRVSVSNHSMVCSVAQFCHTAGRLWVMTGTLGHEVYGLCYWINLCIQGFTFVFPIK